MLRLISRIVFVCAFFGGVSAQENAFFEFSLEADAWRLDLEANEKVYYLLEDSDNLLDFAPMALALGRVAPVMGMPLVPEVRSRFYIIERISVFGPRDTDGDGIDDVFELERPDLLNPLDPTDADMDPDGDGMTNLEDYFEALRSFIAYG